MGLEHDVSREFIAVPDSAKNQLVFKWPDRQIRRWTRAIVDADERAVFIAQGRVVGTLEPGRHTVDATELPFLGDLIDKVTAGNAYDCELFFVSTHEFPDLRFGGSVDAVRDPESKLVVELRGYGEFSMQVVDPTALIVRLTGTVDVADPAAIVHWAGEQLLKAVRTVVVGRVVNDGWPVLGLAARTADIESDTVRVANTTLASYGLEVTRLGNLTVSLSDEDAEQLRAFARATAYTSLAGSFGAYAQGEALLGAGEGMAHGQGSGNEALAVAALGVGAGVLGGIGGTGGTGVTGTTATPGAAAPAATAAAAAPTATALTAAGYCSQCGHALEPGDRFCAACGHAVGSGGPAS